MKMKKWKRKKKNDNNNKNEEEEQEESHTPSLSITFRHLPPNSARIVYTIEAALLVSAQLSTDATSAPRKAWVGC